MRYPTLVLSLICMVFTAGAASAEKRVAFVVGNGTYKNVAALAEPVDRRQGDGSQRCATSASKWSKAPTSPATR